MPRFRTLVFDLDGTLVDSVGSITTALNRLLAEEGLPPVAATAVTNMVGDGALKLLDRGFAAAGRTLGEAELPPLFKRYVPMLEVAPPAPEDIYPGVRETLDRLVAEGCRLAVCTNKPYGPAIEALRAIGLDGVIGAVIGGDSLPERKPQAEPLLAAVRALDGEVSAAAMVGDNANDVGAARAAGMPVIAVSYGYPRMDPEQLGADILIHYFADLPEALERLTRPD
ncbi:MAG: HAD hydrolase-like protein [Alphaproteobacteria bacterium]|jgi:phosphoglycolate phosphatase|nr:HAD hydrolase-like protein [Alphaproteobacteria bacterium]